MFSKQKSYSIQDIPEEAMNAILEENWSLAFQIIRDLAEKENGMAEHFMGWFHEQGVEVPKSNYKAFQWWTRSANKGICESQSALGFAYQYGLGTPVNLQKAYFWHFLAYKNGNTGSYADAKKVEKQLSPWQVLFVKIKLIAKHNNVFKKGGVTVRAAF